jgi:predicted ArsR family transcriptional regulator
MMDAMRGPGGTSPRSDRLGPTRAEVLHQLRSAGRPLPVADIAAAVDLHPNTTRFHLDALTASGLVVRTVEQRAQPGRPKVLYASVGGHQVDHYQNLAAAMVRHFAGDLPDRDERARAVGRAWGDQLRLEHDPAGVRPPLERLVDVMTELGYDPDFVETPSPTVVLRPCPFLELIGDDPQTICQLHFGLACGLVGPSPAWEVTGIEPFVTPTTCLIHLAQRAGEAPVAGTDHAEPANA